MPDHEECKKWISWIHKQNFEDIINSLKNVKNIVQDAESNKYLFKLLLLLSHCADRCYRENLSKEIEIFMIANISCKNLLNIPDKNKFFSALYYILSYLLKKNLFKEAEKICKYLFPGKLVDTGDYQSSKYYQVASLWYSEIFKKLDTLASNSKIENNNIDIEFCSYVKFHLQILTFCDENSCYIFNTANAYIKKLSVIPLAIAFPCILQLFQSLSNYIMTLKVFPLPDAYNLIIPMVGLAFFKRNDAINNSSILNYFRQCDSFFIESLKASSQCYNCYKFFREYSINLLETNFMSNKIGEIRFKKCTDILEILIQKYGTKNNSVVETITAITYSFESLFANWESLVSKQLVNTELSHDDILKMGNFVKCTHNILKDRPLPASYVCKKCPKSDKCLVKKDIYNAAIATSAYMRIIAKFNSEFINEKVFELAKELMEELVSAFTELDKLGCKYSSPMWDLCGRTIFNIGLISEAKYPAQVEELYEVLCTQIVRRDGLNSKISSFGLENPVGTTLHRLCNSNFNQEKFRKAMVYTAYNAILSNYENRKKKAYDMWATIKLKQIDCTEIQELTILKCLEIDADTVKKLGIDVRPEFYDLSDVCLRELKSLYHVKGNMILSMKSILLQLESTNNGLHYAQGVLLLCCHALQLRKRECISGYISKAIKKLIDDKTKTPGNQCLLANLKFFTIIEKLYTRSQAITKQMEDANFTIKAFKKLWANEENDETNDENEVVPTYGGINIEEDGKCAKKLRDVLTTWENCFKKNVISIANDWEPKLTLEIILLCGEYCRLYKFVDNEIKSLNLAYKLSTTLQDFTTCIYVTSRSLSLRCINDEWISSSVKHVENIKCSTKNAEIDVVAVFWLSLADFYFDCKKIEEGKILLEKVKALSNYDMLTNPKIYIYSTDIQFRNYYQINSTTSQEDYCMLMVEIHYLMINLHDIIIEEICKFWNIRFHLFACEQLFEVMCNIVIPMNSLISFRDISAHLSYGLKVAQSFGMTLRIAQYLKYLCYIDLLRIRVEDCEVRLQDLEHILCLEQFNVSMKAKFQPETNVQLTSTPPIRDYPPDVPITLPKNNASPELKKKIFTSPNFLVHTLECQCFTCTSVHYQYLTFSCTHMRAQLYSTLKYTKEAEQYFHGACRIKQLVDQRDSKETRQYKNYKWKRNRNFIIDIMLYLLELSMHIIDFNSDQKEDALGLIEEALEIASQNDLNQHPTAVYAMELYFQYFMYEVLENQLSFAVPDDIPIDITNQPIEKCTTPKRNIEKSARTRRRQKSSPGMTNPVITIIEPNENNCGNSPIPKTNSKDQPIKRPSTRGVRRKILVDEVEEIAGTTRKEEQKTTRKKSTRLSKKSISSSSSSSQKESTPPI